MTLQRKIGNEHKAEALVGLVVVLVAAAFLFLAWQRTGGGGSANAMRVTALFPSANGISVGTDVRVAGLKVGQVSGQRLDPQSVQAEVTLALQPGLRIPADSSAAISADGLLGGSHVSLIPGGATEPMKDGHTILETQGAVDMMSLIGGVINRGGGSEATPAPTTGTMDDAPLPGEDGAAPAEPTP